MNTATGMHIADHMLRLVALQKQASGYAVIALKEMQLSQPFAPHVIVGGDLGVLSDDIRRALGDVPGERLIAVLTGNAFHIQKIPLEMAAENDRREQILWEAAQALISPVEDYDIDFFPAGRVAFWTAIRKKVAEAFANLIPHVPIALNVEPLALFAACQLSGIARAGRHAVIYLGKSHHACIGLDNGALAAAETMRTEHLPAKANQPLRHWVSGDIAPDRRTSSPAQTHFCGEPALIEAACGHFVHADPPPVELQPFARTTFSLKLPHNQSAFAIAAGAAFARLKSET